MVKRKESNQPKKIKRPPLTEAERGNARRLSTRLEALPGHPTLEKIAELWTELLGEGGSQSLISQYKNGDIRLNPTAAILFAAIINHFDPAAHYKPKDILDVPILRALSEPLVVVLKSSWPFSVIDKSRFDALKMKQRHVIEAELVRLILEFDSPDELQKKTD